SPWTVSSQKPGKQDSASKLGLVPVLTPALDCQFHKLIRSNGFLFSLIPPNGCVKTGFPAASSCSNSGTLLCGAELTPKKQVLEGVRSDRQVIARQQLVAQFSCLVAQTFDQPLSISLLVGRHLLAHVVLTILEESVVAAGDLAGRGDDCFATA